LCCLTLTIVQHQDLNAIETIALNLLHRLRPANCRD
jgi:hypothetical protein